MSMGLNMICEERQHDHTLDYANEAKTHKLQRFNSKKLDILLLSKNNNDEAFEIRDKRIFKEKCMEIAENMLRARRFEIRSKAIKNSKLNISKQAEFREMQFFIVNSLRKDLNYFNSFDVKASNKNDQVEMRRKIEMIR